MHHLLVLALYVTCNEMSTSIVFSSVTIVTITNSHNEVTVIIHNQHN